MRVGVLSNLEGNLEKYIEGFFKDKSGSRVEPVEIARRLFREMREQKKVSISNVYAPNEYTVFLHPSDLDRLSLLGPKLAAELQEYVKQKALEKRYTLTGRPLVTFSSDEGVTPGAVRIETSFSVTPAGAVREDEIGKTQPFKHLRGTAAAPRPAAEAILTADAGPDRGKVFPLQKFPLTLGRHAECDIVLNDSSVSRRHARIERQDRGYIIHDLGSTNGVKVNGVKIDRLMLTGGDLIAIGAGVFTFKVE